MSHDDVIKEVRIIRDQSAAQKNYDVGALL